MPSSSDDLTLAMMTSDMNGLKMTMRNTTALCQLFSSTCIFIGQQLALVPETPIPITDFSLTDLTEVKDADAEPNVVQHTVGVFLVEFSGYGLICGNTKL